jgi:hypothetical protein
MVTIQSEPESYQIFGVNGRETPIYTKNLGLFPVGLSSN